MFDIVIKGGRVVDGSGNRGYGADVGISGEVIDAIGDLSRSEAKRWIEATGMVVSPGFIDTHTHSDGALLVDPQHANGLRQGITTEFLGIDGMSYAPLSSENYRTYRHWLGGLLGEPPEDLDVSSVAAFRALYHKKVAINVVYLIPHATIRLQTLGFHDVPLLERALKAARTLVREGMEQGAVGLSTGAKYYPGPWSNTAELVELCTTVQQSGGVYMCEPREANLERAHGGNGVLEALEIARRSNVPLHFAHYRTAPETAGQIQKLMEDIDPAKAEGIDITFDIYPYPSGSSIPVSFLPSDAQEGGPGATIRRLGDAAVRHRIADHLDKGFYVTRMEHMVLSSVPRQRHLEGMTLVQVAAQRGLTLGQTLCELLLEEDLKLGHVVAPPRSIASWRQLNRDYMELLSRPDYMVCSDITPAGSVPHPRAYGAFPRFLGRLRREYGALSLEGMVQRMTDRAARRFGLPRRGRIQRGYYADLVVFDADRVMDNATYDDPCQFPTGIPFVVVNGQLAVDLERCTGALAGQAIP